MKNYKKFLKKDLILEIKRLLKEKASLNKHFEELELNASKKVFDLRSEVNYYKSLFNLVPRPDPKPWIDPYDIHDQWLQFYPEDAYITYLKGRFWVSDGKTVELTGCFHKEVPYACNMFNGNVATHWYFPSDRESKDWENNPPLPPKSN